MAEEKSVELTVGGSPMRTLVYDLATKPKGGVVILHGGYGMEPGVKRMAKRLSLVQYAVVAPDLYHRLEDDADGDVLARIARLKWDDAKADIIAAQDYLTKEMRVPEGRFAIVGFCMGGALAWMAASQIPCKTVVVYYPHEMFSSFGEKGPLPFDTSSDVDVPILGHFGMEDTNPSPADRKKLKAALSDKYPHQFCTYEGAGHGFVSANPEYHRQVPANTSIDRTVGWLDMHLRD